VSEETAREKASQVLRDAVSGILGDVPQESQDDGSSSVLPLASLSAPVSVDEHELSPQSSSRRHRPRELHPSLSAGTQLESERKRPRYEAAPDVAHSIPVTYSSSQARRQSVGCSPIRRHADESYYMEHRHDRSHRHSARYRTTVIHPTSVQSMAHHPNLGNLDEVALLRGELLESDGEEDTPVFRDTQRRR
jgi:hypothetical protein